MPGHDAECDDWGLLPVFERGPILVTETIETSAARAAAIDQTLSSTNNRPCGGRVMALLSG